MKATEISQKIQQSTQMATEIETARQQDAPVAKRGAILFFILQSLYQISNMYAYRSAFILRST